MATNSARADLEDSTLLEDLRRSVLARDSGMRRGSKPGRPARRTGSSTAAGNYAAARQGSAGPAAQIGKQSRAG